MQIVYLPSEKIIFGIPYFDSLLYFNAEVIEQKGNLLLVEYSVDVEINIKFEKIAHTSEIPISYVINK